MKRILVPLSGTDADRRVLDAAIGAIPDAHVDARLFRQDPTSMPVIYGDGYSGDVIDMLIKSAEEQGQAKLAAAKASFEAWQAAANVTVSDDAMAGKPTASFGDVVGPLSVTLLAPARQADLVVMSRAEETDVDQQWLLSTALFETGRPLLLVPDDGALDMRKIAVAWDGSREAALAVTAAMPLLAGADVTVITVKGDADKESGAEGLAATLRMNGIVAKAVDVEPSPNGIFAAIEIEVARLGAGMLVMGAYGHSRLREMIFGGVTREVIEAFPAAVFLAH